MTPTKYGSCVDCDAWGRFHPCRACGRPLCQQCADEQRECFECCERGLDEREIVLMESPEWLEQGDDD